MRITAISIFALASVGVVSAGQIQLGGANGLTTAYVTSGCSGTTCNAGSLGGATLSNYDTSIFSGAANGAATPQPYTQSGGSITSNGETFNLINDPVGGTNTLFLLSQSGNPTMYIPVGVYGVTDVYTLINSLLATAGPDRAATMFFQFGTTSDATTTETVAIKLVNSDSSTTTPDGQVRNAIDCANPACAGYANGPLAGSTDSATLPDGTTAGVTITGNNVYSFTYTSATGVYAGTTGTANLDDQGFLFNDISLADLGAGATNENTYLVNIGIKETGEDPSSFLGISAITVDAAVVPEPSTVLLFLAGVGAIGVGRLRRKA